MTDPPSRQVVRNVAGGPAPYGPYSPAVAYGGLLFCSGTIAPAADDDAEASIGAETARCLENLAAVCRTAGTELSRALRLTIYTTRIEAFWDINQAYGRFFDEDPPARVTVGVASLPAGARVEIDAVVAFG